MFNVLRTKNLSRREDLTTAVAHNLRFDYAINHQNIDQNGQQPIVLANPLGVDFSKSGNMADSLEKYWKEIGLKKQSNNSWGKEFVISASPEFFEHMSQENIEAWANHQIEFLNQEFPGSVKLAVLHQDEKTPHIHIITTFEAKTVKRYKNQVGEFFKESWSLQGYKLDKQGLINLHTNHAKFNQSKGYELERGVEGSMARNLPLKDFYKALNRAIDSQGKDEPKMTKWVEDLTKLPVEAFAKNRAQIVHTVKTLFERNGILAAQVKSLKSSAKLQKDLKEKESKLLAKEEKLRERANHIKEQEKLILLAQRVMIENQDLKDQNSKLNKEVLTYRLIENETKKKEAQERQAKINEVVQTKKQEFGRNQKIR